MKNNKVSLIFKYLSVKDLITISNFTKDLKGLSEKEQFEELKKVHPDIYEKILKLKNDHFTEENNNDI